MTREGLLARAVSLAQALPAPGHARPSFSGPLSGEHGIRRAGSGESFWQFREYASGDPARMIDWRRSARTEGVFVREKEQQAPQFFYIRGDHSASMAYASTPDLPTKKDYADLLLLALSARLLMMGEHVGLAGSERRPFSGFSAFDDLAAFYMDGLEAGIAGHSLRADGELYIAGDFFQPPDDLVRDIDLMGAVAAGDMIWVLDPAERGFPFNGHVRFLDSEGGPDYTATEAHDLRSGYLERLAAHENALAQIALGRSLGFHAVSTADDPAEVLRRFRPFSGGTS